MSRAVAVGVCDVTRRKVTTIPRQFPLPGIVLDVHAIGTLTAVVVARGFSGCTLTPHAKDTNTGYKYWRRIGSTPRLHVPHRRITDVEGPGDPRLSVDTGQPEVAHIHSTGKKQMWLSPSTICQALVQRIRCQQLVNAVPGAWHDTCTHACSALQTTVATLGRNSVPHRAQAMVESSSDTCSFEISEQSATGNSKGAYV